MFSAQCPSFRVPLCVYSNGTPLFKFSFIIEGTNEKVYKLYTPVSQHYMRQVPIDI